jgi:hypothetical protein
MCTSYVASRTRDSSAPSRIEVELQPLANVAERHLVARVVAAAFGLVRIAQNRVNVAALAEDVDRHHARRARRLDPVIDRVFEQRLQTSGGTSASSACCSSATRP